MLHRWKRFDLHFHTTEDKDRKSKDLNIRKILKKYNEEEVGLIAITNHNILSKSSKKNIEKIIYDEKYSIKVIWGVELDIYYEKNKDKYFHSIVIFEDNKLYEMKKIIIKYYPNENSNKKDALCLKEFVDLFIKGNGYVVVPHFGTKHRSIEHEEISKQFDRFHIINKFDFLDGSFDYDKISKFFNDDGTILHHNREYKFSDGKSTSSVIKHIKNLPQTICDASFEGLQNASLTSNSNILINDKIQSSHKPINDFTIEKEKIIFQPGLTTIVGEKGSGKSRLINSIINILNKEDKEDNSFSNLKINNNTNEITSIKIHVSKQNHINKLISTIYSYDYKEIDKIVEKQSEFKKFKKKKVDFDLIGFKSKAIVIKDNYKKLGNQLKEYYKLLKKNNVLNDKAKSTKLLNHIFIQINKHWNKKINKEKRDANCIKNQLQGLNKINTLIVNEVFNKNTKDKLKEAFNLFSKYVIKKTETYNNNLINNIIYKYIKDFNEIKNNFSESLYKVALFDFDWEKAIEKPIKDFNEHKKNNVDKIFDIQNETFEKIFNINDNQLKNILKFKILKNKIKVSEILKIISDQLLNKEEDYSDNFKKVLELNASKKKRFFEKMNEVKMICGEKNLLNKSPGEQQEILINETLKQDYDCYIIDQPEDDMDAQTIKKTIVEKIRKDKFKQYIIVTHDPKIVINAESNLIIRAKKMDNKGKKNGKNFEYNTFSFKDLNIKTNDIAEIIDGDKRYVEERAKVYKGGNNEN